MSQKYRILFFTIFAIFFVATTPFLVLYSLGYDLNLSRGSLTNSITINVDSRPRTSDIYSNERLLLRNSGELRAQENQLVPLSIKKTGYLDENFLIWSGDDENTTARITNLWMLPTTPDTIEQSSSITFVSLLAKDLAIIKKDNNYYVQLYSFGGLQGNAELITSTSVSTLPVVPSDGQWDVINETTYWDKQNELILVRKNDQWLIYNTRFFVANPAYVAYVNTSELLILDNGGHLWIWNYITNQFRFLDSGFDGMSFTQIPQYIWLWKSDTIYRVNPNQISDQIRWEDYIFTVNTTIIPLSEQKTIPFTIKNVYQGIFIKIGGELMYVPDYDKSSWYLLATNVRVANAFDNSIIWIDDRNQIWVYNLQLKNVENIATIDGLASIPDESIRLFYYFLWRRVVIYTPTGVQTVWYDKDILNKSIVGYTVNNWIENKQCYSELVDRYQFCIENGNLIAYKNTSLW